MVDSRKSIQARQQRRRANGEFAEEQDTGLPSGDTLTDFERKRLNNAMLAAETNINGSQGIFQSKRTATEWLARGMG